MKVNSAKEIGLKVSDITGIDIFKNTRKREYVEGRALVVYLLRKKLLMRWVMIAKYFQDNGKHMDHCTAIYLCKSYLIYKESNPMLGEIETMFSFKSKLNYDEIDKIHYTENKLKNSETKNEILTEKIKTLEARLNDPIMQVLKDITPEQRLQAEERLTLLKQSWAWKYEDKCEIIESSDGISGSAY